MVSKHEILIIHFLLIVEILERSQINNLFVISMLCFQRDITVWIVIDRLVY